MKIQPIIVGTAGHIDHGKSTLVKTLTGIDPDRLKEEIERGMTIDLGFARFALPDGRTVGIIDVPGHERFIKNMVAGASGIDLVILVVAADDGVMPQTREHLSIMGLLGVSRGLIALTKIDTVEAAMVELAADDIRSAVRGTFLEGAPILRVSSITGAGIDELRAVLSRLALETPPRSDSGIFRMPIQRVFSAHGFGTIVTGIPQSGAVNVGDVLEVLPQGLRGKVRGLQAYHELTERARAGHSTAINLADVDYHDVVRGDVIATPGFFRPATMLGARLTALATLDRPIENRMAIRLHTGTAETLGEVILLDCEELAPGAVGLVQFRLDAPVVAAPGDRFVVRLASPAWTLGGGVILEESKHRLKRFKNFIVDELSRQAESLSSPRKLLEVVLSRRAGLVSAAALAVEIKRSKTEVEQLLAELQAQGRVRQLADAWVHVDRLAAASKELEQALAAWFVEQAHREVVDIRDLRRVTGFEAQWLDALLGEHERLGLLKRESGGQIRPANRAPDLDPAMRESCAAVTRALLASRFQPPSPAELATSLRSTEKQIRAALELLVDRGDVHRVASDFYLAREHFEGARAALTKNCQTHSALDIPSLRDELATTRKYIIPLLEHFDALGVTLRQGAQRVLKRRGGA